jgi:hypothetical protein
VRVVGEATKNLELCMKSEHVTKITGSFLKLKVKSLLVRVKKL